MKTKFLLLIFLALLAAAGTFAYKHVYKNQVIILNNDQAIITEETWVLSDSLFYKSDGDVHSVPMDQVVEVKPRGILRKGYGTIVILKHHLAPWKHKSLDIVSQAQIETSTLKKWAPVVAIVLVGIGLLIVTLLLLKKLFTALKSKKALKKDTESQVSDTRVYEGQESVVHFFLSLFKAQKGVDPSAEAMFRPIESRSPDGNYTYELRVKIDDDWASRRMTIGPIGEESGSRSKCYYVIYDDHIVVKISPGPPADFNRYISNINRDNRMAAKLGPRECLVPRVSVVLKKIHTFENSSDLTIEQLEKKYIKWLEENEDFQSYLKIGDVFAYFMDLSKYYFLGNILQEIHNIDAKITKEVSKYPDILWNPMEFEARFGSQNVSISDGLNPVYTSFRNRFYDFLQKHHLEDTVSEFNIKAWFLRYLSGNKLVAADLDAKPNLVSEMNGIALKLFNEKRQPTEKYQDMIRAFVVSKNLKQHNSQISSMVINLMDLLYWLDHKKLAMRDLKPDNLLIAGNPSSYPRFLESANLYSIGLIDVETAVSYDTAEKGTLRQPPLGGTPTFATPSHQLKNKTIQKIFKNLPLILHLQDWYATIGMIYQCVTGDRLFERTAKNLINLKKTMKEKSGSKENYLAVLQEISQSFWKIATAEFNHKTNVNKKRLRFISLIVSQEAKELLLSTFADTHQLISKSVHKLLVSQSAFKGEKIQKSLYAAPPMKIYNFKIKFSEGKGKQLPEEERDAALKVLDDLTFLKQQSEQLVTLSNLLKKSVPIVSVHNLLRAMFIVVLVHMHQKVWGAIPK